MPKTTQSERTAIHRRLAERWLSYGLLIFAGNRLRESSLAESILSLPQDLRKLWQLAMKHGRSIPGPEGWQGLEGVQALTDLKPASGTVKLVCLERDWYYLALDLDPKTAGITTFCPELDIEVASFEYADQSEAFRTAEDTGKRSIEENCIVRQLWGERFHLLANCSSNLTIVDQYALKPGNSIDGLVHLLVLLDQSAKRCKVDLYCCYGYDQSGAQERLEDITHRLTGIRNKLTRGGIPNSEIYLHATHFGEFRNFAHDRYLRFDSHVFELGTGVEIFCSGTDGRVPRRTTSSFKRRDEFHNKTEEYLRSHRHRSCPWQV